VGNLLCWLHAWCRRESFPSVAVVTSTNWFNSSSSSCFLSGSRGVSSGLPSMGDSSSSSSRLFLPVDLTPLPPDVMQASSEIAINQRNYNRAATMQSSPMKVYLVSHSKVYRP
jgi:hypothetical protein